MRLTRRGSGHVERTQSSDYTLTGSSVRRIEALHSQTIHNPSSSSALSSLSVWRVTR